MLNSKCFVAAAAPLRQGLLPRLSRLSWAEGQFGLSFGNAKPLRCHTDCKNLEKEGCLPPFSGLFALPGFPSLGRQSPLRSKNCSTLRLLTLNIIEQRLRFGVTPVTSRKQKLRGMERGIRREMVRWCLWRRVRREIIHISPR